MTDKRRLLLFILVMLVVTASVATVTATLLNRAAFEQTRANLMHIVMSQATLIESMAKFDAQFSARNFQGSAFAATMCQVNKAHHDCQGFGKTGEFLIAKREGGKIVFLLSDNPLTSQLPAPVPIEVEEAAAMRRALGGEEGTMIGPDYNGHIVLAAYAPIPTLELGVVAKIDTKEIYAPFIKSAFITAGVALILIFIGALLIIELGNPILERLKQQAKDLKTEIQERKLAELKLEKLIDSAPVGIVVTDADGTIVTVNQGVLKLFGYTESELLGQNVDVLVPENLRIRHAVLRKNFTANPHDKLMGTNRVLPAVCKDGTSISVEVGLGPMETKGNLLIAATVQDVSPRIKAEFALIEERQFAVDILNSLPESVAVLDELGRINHVNQTWKQFGDENDLDWDNYGLNANYLVICEKAARNGDKTAHKVVKNLTLLIQGKKNKFSIEYPCHGPKVKRWFLLTATRFTSSSKTRILLTHTNITQHKLAESAIVTAKKTADEANRAKSAFLANMSHEIRTPLNAILGFTQLLQRDTTLMAHQHQYLKTINRSGEHLLGLINDILDVSKIEAGRIVLTPVNFDLHKILEDMEMMFRVRTDKKNLQWSVEYSPNIPRSVLGDESKLRQILINLLGNAVKFTEQGGLVLRAHTGSDDPFHLYFEIEDTGHGIAEEEQELLFKPFEQTLAGLKSQEGTGLGLALSKQYAQMIGNGIWVRSSVGVGSVFGFDMNLKPGEEYEDNTPSLGQVKRLKPGQQPVCILIVDDQQENRIFLHALLNEVGFITREAANGQEAIESAFEYKPDLILMDIAMPVMDGYEATKRIRAQKQNIIIFGVTASAFEDNRKAVLESGANDYIRKPIVTDILFEKIREHLKIEYEYTATNTTEQDIPESDLVQGNLKVVVKNFPTDLCNKLREATLSADMDRLEELMTEVEQIDADAARSLRQILMNFDYDSLLSLLGGEDE